MSIYSNTNEEFIQHLMEWCKNNPLDLTTLQNNSPPWNLGKPWSEEIKKSISESKKGHSYNKGCKNPSAIENLKKINHRAYGKYEITDPNGKTTIIINLKEYCKNNNLKYRSMSSLANGKWPCKTYKGYTAKKLGYVKIHQSLQANSSSG
jgi:hypothetical protein